MSNTTVAIMALVANKLGHREYNPPSYRELGRALGVSHTHAARWLRGQQTMTRDAFVNAMQFLDLPTAEVMEFSERLNIDALRDDGARAWFEERCREWDCAMAELKKNSGKAAAVILTAMLWHPSPARAMTYEPARAADHAVALYIIRSI